VVILKKKIFKSMTYHKQIASVLFVIAYELSLSSSAAQPSEAFYPRDHAVAPAVVGTAAISNPKLPSHSDNSGAIDQGPNRSNYAKGAQAGSHEQAKKRRVVVYLYVNSIDREHLKSALEVARRIHDERIAFVGAIHHIGDYRNLSAEDLTEFERLGITVIGDLEPRLEVAVTNSPVWRLVTEQGIHLLEGEVDITRYFNSFGEYDPNSSQGAGIEVKMEGF
jgi:hypothetical protein